MGEGSWEAFVADRFPEPLDAEIKKVHQQFYLAAKHLKPEELLVTLPMSLPMAGLGVRASTRCGDLL
eukprot:12904105-Prorocentrum_lima.AAC.1